MLHMAEVRFSDAMCCVYLMIGLLRALHGVDIAFWPFPQTIAPLVYKVLGKRQTHFLTM